MTSAQFYFAIGLPIFSILLVWLGSTVANNRAINALGQRIDDLGKRIDGMDHSLGQRIDGMDHSLGQRIDGMDHSLGQRIDGLGQSLGQRIGDLDQSLGQRIDDLRSEMRAGFASVNARIDRLETRFDRMEDEVRKDHESRLSRLEARVFTRTA